MRIHVTAMAAAVLLAAVVPAHADPDAAMRRMETAMTAAQAQAERPGDAALTCEALENEVIAFAEDPKIQAFAQEHGAQAEQRIDKIGATPRAAAVRAGLDLLLGMAGSFVPGVDLLQWGLQSAESARMQGEARKAETQVMAMMDQLIPLMPQMMRGQRVYELAQARQCAFLEQAGPRSPR